MYQLGRRQHFLSDNALSGYSVSRTRKKFADWPAGKVQSLPLCWSVTGEAQSPTDSEPTTAAVKSVCPSTTGAAVMTGFPFVSKEIVINGAFVAASPKA